MLLLFLKKTKQKTTATADFERRSLRASASVQDELGCPVIIHPGRHPDCPGEAMRILMEAGGQARHTVMSHLDREYTLPNNSDLKYFESLEIFCIIKMFKNSFIL